ncbi:MAG: hypothetical protein OIN88_01500 [Candidatus Methanoperedens sp.]|nr:hypothetical protein [Candidatus Methanoperedens sp.]MCZ7359754.1 hypothetical protein [Candidatus Methanoperedens sp.]HLB72149.1 hypothetical protein [Candidatus Methanoperedens sp.]
MSAETSVVVALFFVGFLVVAVTTYSSFDYYMNLVKKAQYDQDSIKKGKMQTDITITNITNSSQRLNLTINNTGRTTLNVSAMHVFVRGILYNYSVSGINTWVSKTGRNISIYPVTYASGDRIKITTENGISDYILVP